MFGRFKIKYRYFYKYKFSMKLLYVTSLITIYKNDPIVILIISYSYSLSEQDYPPMSFNG